MKKALFLLLLVPYFFIASVPEEVPVPKQKFVLAGGGDPLSVIQNQFVDLAGGGNARIIVIPSATLSPNLDSYTAHWRKTAAASIEIVHFRRPEDANDPYFYNKIRNATGVWLSGGDQTRLAKLICHTIAENELHALLRRGGVIGGTSAGASIASDVMIAGNNEEGVGLGLLPNIIVDQHFDKRKRLERLQRLLKKHPQYVGLGIDECTAIVIEGNKCKVIGKSGVTICVKDEVVIFKSGESFSYHSLRLLTSR